MRYLSKTTILTMIALFAVGVAIGGLMYLSGPVATGEPVAAASAVPAHLAAAAIAVVLFVGLPRLEVSRRAPYSIWVAPFSRSALDRVRWTLLLRSGASASNVVWAVIATLLLLLLLYNPLRAGQQALAGLDPAFTANAWGGPSYLGAMLAHYLDAAYLFYAEAFLLDLVLVPPSGVVQAQAASSRSKNDR